MYECRENRQYQGQVNSLPECTLRTLQHVVAGFAFVSADGAHVVGALEAVWQEQAGIRDHRRHIALQLAVDFGERPEPIFQARQPWAQSWLQEREAQEAQNGDHRCKRSEKDPNLSTYWHPEKAHHSLFGNFSKISDQMLIVHFLPQNLRCDLLYGKEVR